MQSEPQRLSQLPAHPAVIPARSTESESTSSFLPLQRQLAVGSVDDPLEREADAVAERVISNSPGAAPAGSHGAPVLHRHASGAVPQMEAPPIVHEALRSGGEPLDVETRAFMEPRIGHDLSGVRIHTGSRADESARAVAANAYTVGQDAVFAAGRFNPRTSEGQRLLAHELAHTIQQPNGNRAAAGASARHEASGVVRRQPNSGGQETPASQLPPVQVPGTGITVVPGPSDPTSLAGVTVPLPASLRLTNMLSVGSGPTYVADIAPKQLVLTLLDGIDLSTSTRPGTPPNAAPSAENRARIRLIQPILTFDTASQTFRGHATLQIPSDYPPAYHGPTDLDVDISSTELGQFTGRVGYGPLYANFSLRLHYQTERLEQAATPAFKPQGGFAGFWTQFQQILRETIPGIRLENHSAALQSLVHSFEAGEIQGGDLAARTAELLASSLPPTISAESIRKAVNQFVREVTHPGFTLKGKAGIGGLPLTTFGAEAPTTVPLAHPLPGAPAKFPISYHAAGVVIAPAGAVTQTAVPAFGVTGASFNEKRGISGTAAILPTISPSALSAGQGAAAGFPTYAYAEVSYVRRISRDLDMGVRLTLQVNSAQLFGPQAAAPTDPASRLSQTIQDYQTAAAQTPGTDTAPPPNVGISVFGRFSGL